MKSKALQRFVFAALVAGLSSASTAIANSPLLDQHRRSTRNEHYLIVVGQALESAIEPFANFKAANGFDVTLHVLGPGVTFESLRADILDYWESANPPDYVLLVGDTDTVPTYEQPQWNQGDTDLYFVCMDGGDDWYPEVPIGRFPARTEAHLQAMIDKTITVETGDFPDPLYTRRAAMVATGDTASGAEGAHDYVIETWLEPRDFESFRLYAASFGADTQDVINALDLGTMWCVYMGHSGSSGWMGPSFYAGDVHALENFKRYPFLFSYSCNAGKFTVDECIGETWMRVAEKGAVTVIATSTYIYWTDPPWTETIDLEHAFFEAVYDDGIGRIGPAWQAALYKLLDIYGPANPVCRDYFEMFNLLGDPSLTIPMDPMFSVSVDPTMQAGCGDSSAAYDVAVSTVGGFNELVSLSVPDLPTGMVAHFSTNHSTPPFESTLTLTLGAEVAEGLHSLEILGSAISAERSVPFGVHVAHNTPSAFPLLTPPDGADDQSLSPMMTWELSVDALDYHLEIATDPDFNNIVHETDVEEPSFVPPFHLQALTTYYWRVTSSNGCGETMCDAPSSFTTTEQPDYFTEEFTSQFDLDGRMVTFEPDGSFNHYRGCQLTVSDLLTDPAGGIELPLADDDFEPISPTAPIPFYGQDYDTVFVGSNGVITFEQGDTVWSESLSEHFSMKRISVCFDDLNPNAGGTVSWKQLPDRVVVTWLDVPEFGSSNSNTFQAELHHNGVIRLAWVGIDSDDSIVGLSEGFGVPSDFLDTDLSAMIACGGCAEDLDGDGDVNVSDLLALIAAWGLDEHPADVNGDGTVDVSDLLQLLNAWGPCL